MLWVDAHRPKSLDECTLHPETTALLRALAQSGNVPHLLFYGPSGAGKKTRILALLQEIYGSSVHRAKVEVRSLKANATATPVEAQVLQSNFHIEVSPADAGNKDVVVVQQLIKEVASSNPLGTHSFKVVVLNDADALSRQAQAALRRTMEKYVSSCRIFMCVENLSKVIAPLRSRCVCVRLPAPSVEDLSAVLHTVAQKEKIKVPEQLATNIAYQSGRDVRRAILTLEAARAQQYPLADNQPIPTTPWEANLREVVQMMMEEQTPKCLLQVRTRLYDLLTACIPAHLILKTLCSIITTKVDPSLHLPVLHAAATYDHTRCLGQKDIFHLEAFVGRFMSLFKDFLTRSMS
jgi:replication factor C subunit 3/5